MLEIKVRNKNNELVRVTDSPMFDVIDVDGIIPSSATVNSSVMANGDGALFNSSRLNIRPLSISFAIKPTVEKNRLYLYELFPVKKNVRLHFANKSRKVYIDGIVESYDGSLFELKQIITVNFRCLDPYFQNEESNVVQNSQVIDLFEFPFDIEAEGKEFSVFDTSVTQNIINRGDSPTGMMIELTASGEVINPTIYNADTRQSFKLNFTMITGDLIRINTKTKQCSIQLVRGGQVFNLINQVERGAEWFKLGVGDNIFTFTTDSGTEFLSVKFIYTDIYQGV